MIIIINTSSTSYITHEHIKIIKFTITYLSSISPGPLIQLQCTCMHMITETQLYAHVVCVHVTQTCTNNEQIIIKLPAPAYIYILICVILVNADFELYASVTKLIIIT